MSAGRFKPKDDYFTRRSGFAERVIAAKPQKTRKRAVETSIPATLLRVPFCKTVDAFRIEGKGTFKKGEYPLDEALRLHLDGEETVLVDPLSHTGETAFTVVRFDLSEDMDHPFSEARRFADELRKHSIPSLIEVTEGGKGHYHLWIFHEEPVLAWKFSDALMRLGREMFGMMIETVPSVKGEEFVPLPLQGESVLLQRRVFVNSVGKMIRDQGNVLRTIEYCPKRVSEAFIAPRPIAAEPPPVVRMTDSRAPAAPVRTPVSRDMPPRQTPKIPPAAAALKPSIKTPDMPAPPVSPPPRREIIEIAEQPPAAKPAPRVERRPPEIPAVTVPAVTAPAAPAPTKPAPVPSTKILLVFVRGGREYGIPPASVKGVYSAEGIVSTPGMGRWARGMMNIGGNGVLVLDMMASPPPSGSAEHVPGPSIPAHGRIVVLGGEHDGYGFLAERVPGVSIIHGATAAHRGDEGPATGAWVSPDGAARILLPDIAQLCVKPRAASDGSGGRMRSPQAAIPEGGYLLFSTGGGRYCVPAHAVERVFSLSPAGAPGGGDPRAPVRKRVYLLECGGTFTVADSEGVGPAAAPCRGGRAFVVSDGERSAEVTVDSVEGVRKLNRASIFPVCTAPGGTPGGPVIAIAHPSGEARPIFILDPAVFLR
jgi:chemotaxis signal transduction protein